MSLPCVGSGFEWRKSGNIVYLGVDFDYGYAAFVTRLGGVSTGAYEGLNVGRIGDGAQENRNRLWSGLGISSDRVAWARQVHGCDCVTVDEPGFAGVSADIIQTSSVDVHLLGLFADCVPVVLFSDEVRAVALVHAGWRGTANSICVLAVDRFCQQFKCRPESITGAIGPCIGVCCYEVGSDVFYEITGRRIVDSGYVDLKRENQDQLRRAGVGKIIFADICTFHHEDLFFSHRASGGKTGRFGVVTGING